jgi:hypothetical protein
VRAWLILGFLVAARWAPAATVLTLVEEDLHRATSSEIDAWRQQVESEGNYTVVLRVIPGATHQSRRRLRRLQENRELVEELKPDAVQLFGSVPIGASGWQGADGHGPRCVYTDLPYMIGLETPLTDTRDFGTDPREAAWSNRADDGRWDQNVVEGYRRPAARVDFSELPIAVEWVRVPSGCLKGDLVCPRIDEEKAFRDYLRRNLEYRRGEWNPPREAWMQGNLWDMAQGIPRRFAKENMPQFKWIEVAQAGEVAGKDVFLLFHNVDRDHLYEFVDADCRWVRAVWANSYRSFTMEQYATGGVFRRWLQHALVSTWGPAWWVIPPSARTVGDAITATARKHPRWNVLFTVAGDVTLPLKIESGK